MARKRTTDDTELTDTEKAMLQEMIIAYQSVKMMSRLMKCVVFFLFLLILDFSRLMDAIDNVFAHLKQWFSKH
ncbi:hypothetical protein [Bartonella pachyuromydis]|uniref:Uncharacterized protein n=1 Tax=Bartonella pachyuromydis TaxID=931097 RepID=A0ABP8VC42_9HYPH